MIWSNSYRTERGRCVSIDWLTWQQLYRATKALETWQPESKTSEYGHLTSKNTKQL